MSFSEDMTKLQDIVNSLDSGNIPLEDSLVLFEEGVALVNSCRQYLETAQQKILLLSSDNNDIKGSLWDPLGEDINMNGENY